jgi:Protein of unknown function (DUF2797)
MGMGMLRKMRGVANADGRVVYALRLGDAEMPLAERIGSSLRIAFTGQRTCTVCGAHVKKFYGQGTCFPCLRDAPEASECIVRPELCRAHLGEGRDVDWERAHHAQEHVVYLAHTGAIKVGVTRSAQVPTRWIDQGATAAVAIARVPYRQLAGLMEVELKAKFADKTNYRAMLLTREAPEEALLQARTQAQAGLSEALRPYALWHETPLRLHYPVKSAPVKVVSVTLEKQPVIEGDLAGIKGQYLLWSDGRVFNVRNHSGYHVAVD